MARGKATHETLKQGSKMIKANLSLSGYDWQPGWQEKVASTLEGWRHLKTKNYTEVHRGPGEPNTATLFVKDLTTLSILLSILNWFDAVWPWRFQARSNSCVIRFRVPCWFGGLGFSASAHVCRLFPLSCGVAWWCSKAQHQMCRWGLSSVAVAGAGAVLFCNSIDLICSCVCVCRRSDVE